MGILWCFVSKYNIQYVSTSHIPSLINMYYTAVVLNPRPAMIFVQPVYVFVILCHSFWWNIVTWYRKIPKLRKKWIRPCIFFFNLRTLLHSDWLSIRSHISLITDKNCRINEDLRATVGQLTALKNLEHWKKWPRHTSLGPRPINVQENAYQTAAL